MAQPIPIQAPSTNTLLDAIPLPLFIVDWDVSILGANRAARDLLDATPEQFLRQRGGEALHCLHARESEHGCGTTRHCSDCMIRGSVRRAEQGEEVVREKAKLQRAGGGPGGQTHLLVTATRFEHEGETRALLMLEDITEWVDLGRLIPICASCKKIRNDSQYWERLETFFGRHAGVTFTHGCCPDCAEQWLRESQSRSQSG